MVNVCVLWWGILLKGVKGRFLTAECTAEGRQRVNSFPDIPDVLQPAKCA